MKTKIKYGIVGSGLMGCEHISNINLIDSAEVVAISDSNENSINKSSISNGYSSISNAIWVVPIKSMSSFGMSLSPYADQRIALVDQDTSIFQVFDTTYNYTRSFDRSGGILSFKIGTSYKVNKNIAFGYYYGILFGSSRKHESIYFDGSAIIQSGRIRYNGILNDIFLTACTPLNRFVRPFKMSIL